jgi:putative peptidoglycan lipid II flippase
MSEADQTPSSGSTPATTSGLLRSSAVVSAGTALSRITGLIRTVVIAVALTTALADAYNLANTAPNVVYDLILGGVLAATLIPVLVTATDRGDEAGQRAVGTVVALALVVLTAVAIVAAPAIVRLYTFTLDPAERAAQEAVAVPLLRLFLPQVLFYGLTALFSALLNAHRRFAAAAFAPVVNNVVVIVVLVAVSRMAGGSPTTDSVLADPAQMWLLGGGTTLGIIAMALVLVPAMRRSGVPVGWNPDWRNPAVARIARLSGWTVAYVVVNQVGLIVLLALSNSSAPEGGLSAYSYAYLFFQLPYGLFAVAVMTAFLPELSAAANEADLTRFRERFGVGLRLILVVLAPCAVAYLTLAGPLVDLVFERGNFTVANGDLTAEALAVFGAALPGFAVFMYTMRGFYARKDTRTPFLLTTVKIGMMVVAAWPLAAAFGIGGVVAAFGGAFALAAVAALVLLGRRVGGVAGPGTWGALTRTALATAVMVVVALVVPRGLAGSGLWASAVDLAVVGGVATAAYLGTLVALGSPDLRWALAQTRLRLRRSSDGTPGGAPR